MADSTLWTNWWASPSLGLACGAAACLALCLAMPVRQSLCLGVWLLAEVVWFLVVKWRFVPRLTTFRPEDAAAPITEVHSKNNITLCSICYCRTARPGA